MIRRSSAIDQALRAFPEARSLAAAVEALRPIVDAYVTKDRVRRYVSALADMPAPSTAASAFRLPVLKTLLEEDGALGDSRLQLHENFEGTGSTVMLTGGARRKPIWYFAHLDSISYLVRPESGGRYPLVPFCYHMIENGDRQARAYRYDLYTLSYRMVASGRLQSEGGVPFFLPSDPHEPLAAGDRVVPIASYSEDEPSGTFVGHADNAGGVAALAVAAPLLARANVEALLAFPDEEEGPRGSGSQVIGRGGTRIVNQMPTPDLAIVADMQQAGGDLEEGADADDAARLGGGAMLAEFSSLARGAVTPPPLYTLARAFIETLAAVGVRIQESRNTYTSRSDDVSVLLKTPNILLLGFPGLDRHFDRAEPRANLNDLVDLAKSLVYFAALQPQYRAMQHRIREADA